MKTKTRKPEVPDRELLTVAEAARFPRISESLFFKLRAEGKLKVVKVGWRTLVRRVDLEKFLEQATA